jgi:hypothetical protein
LHFIFPDFLLFDLLGVAIFYVFARLNESCDVPLTQNQLVLQLGRILLGLLAEDKNRDKKPDKLREMQDHCVLYHAQSMGQTMVKMYCAQREGVGLFWKWLKIIDPWFWLGFYSANDKNLWVLG